MLARPMVMAVLMAAPVLAFADEGYPTLDRLNYALDCMDRHGGQSMDNLVACSCEIDKVAAKMPYDEYIDANIYMQHKDMPGDKGAVFRDAGFAKERHGALVELQSEAEKGCFIGQRGVQRKADAAAASETKAPAADEGEAKSVEEGEGN